jgi:hypothetical protein
MRTTAMLFGAIALTVLCWGLYGPVLREGQMRMALAPPSTTTTVVTTPAGAAPADPKAAETVTASTEAAAVPAKHPALLRPFVCVGLAYFLIGVIVPAVWLHYYGEKGEWTVTGLIWSLAGGALGAIGALGIILAFKFGGKPVYVMPLVFGGAPVINAFLTIYLGGRMKEIGPWFLAGLIMVVLGAVTVLLSGPGATSHAAAESASVGTWMARLLAIALALCSWGAYGPVLHKGQANMHHSRLRPLLCVGMAYFLIAVIVPYFFLGELGEASTYKSVGTLWAIAGGAFGAVGALGIIMAFNFGGKPIYVMPLVFGGAPVINTLVAVATQGQFGNRAAFFLAGMILVIAGSAMVLVLAPRGDAPVAARA